MVIVYNEERNKYQATDMLEDKSVSPLANWIVDKKIVKTPRGAEYLLTFLIFIIFVIAAIAFSYGIGVNKIKDLEDGNTEFLNKS